MNTLKMFKNKTVIVTGHTGFKGSWLTLVLIYLVELLVFQTIYQKNLLFFKY